MIKIEEKPSKHVVGETSLFISFDYSAEIVSAIKQCDGCYYDSKTSIWEAPISELTHFLNLVDTNNIIQLNVLKDTNVKHAPETVADVNIMKTKPFPYQLEGINYGLNHDKFLLLDAPGLGKTLQIIYIAQQLKKTEKLKHCLIVCGINTLKTNWKKEINIHSNLDCKILGERTKKNGEVYYAGLKERLDDLKSPIKEFFVVTNIETLRNNDVVKLINKGKNEFDMIVVDEVHQCKNPTSQQGKNLLKLKTAKHVIGATGTVLTNSPLDAYVPLKFIGKEKCAYSTFKYYFCKYGGIFNNELLGFRHMDVLKDTLDTCSIRRTKELLDLPEKTIIHEIVDMNSTQAAFYNNVKDGIVSQVDKVHISTASLLAMLARLRQATACPSILTTEKIESSKLTRCKDLVEQIVSNGEKVVVFSTFKETLNSLYSEISYLNPLICTGDVKDSDISANIDKFQTDPACKVMLATWQKMGTGITLTAANNAIFIDCAWTAANNQQAEDRVHRIGSKKPVFIYYLWANNTVDMRVKELVEDKSLVANYVVDDELPPQLIDRLKKLIIDLK